MCYSAQIWQNFRDYSRTFGADISVKEFVDLYWLRAEGAKVKIPKAMDAPFLKPKNADERKIKALIDDHNRSDAARLEEELFSLRKRLADADRSLQKKATKAATESKRIATDKIERAKQMLADNRRTTMKDRDSRIFPGYYAPVLVMENERRVIKPMRYQCRLAGKPASYDRRFPGCYNARRDNLEGFWKKQFGATHGLVVMSAFYENVSRHRLERRELSNDEAEQNVVLEFRPEPAQDMLVACLWSRWQGPGEPDLLSFAAITDEPPAEVIAAGHDRCIVPIKPQNVDAWLRPDASRLAEQYAILEDKERPYFEYRKAA